MELVSPLPTIRESPAAAAAGSNSGQSALRMERRARDPYKEDQFLSLARHDVSN